MDYSRSAPDIGRGVLQAIYAVFLGLILTAVVGVGTYTFHPDPGEVVQDQIQALHDERGAIDGCNTPTPEQCRTWEELSAAEQARTKAIDARVADLQKVAEDRSSGWRQSTSIILIVIATLLMALSLALRDSVSVLSNGILLGGLFTMLYGVGWGLVSGNSLTRFLVLLVALAVSVALGYLKFARGRRPTAVGAAGGADAGGMAAAVKVPSVGARTEDAAIEALSDRVATLERRLAAAAASLGTDVRDDQDSPDPDGSTSATR